MNPTMNNQNSYRIKQNMQNAQSFNNEAVKNTVNSNAGKNFF